MNINPFDILKNAQKVQEQLGGLQEKLEAITVKGSSGGGMVEVELSGRFEMIAVRIAPQIVNGGDVEMLQDLVMAAFTDGIAKIKEAVGNETASITGGLLSQGGFNLTGFPGGIG